ncbi:MAG: hypothetical protein ACPL3P_09660, partial [Anaerolineales bacterium]
MEISTLPNIYPTHDLLPTQFGSTSISGQNWQPTTDSLAISPQAQLLFSYQGQGFKLNQNQTSSSYAFPDKSGAFQISRGYSLQTNTEAVQIRLSYLSDKYNPSDQESKLEEAASIRLVLRIHRVRTSLDYQLDVKKIQTIRKPEEILKDLMEGIQEVLKKYGNHVISIEMDEEAIKSI